MQTDEWLLANEGNLEKVLKKIKPELKNHRHYYQYLSRFGMYRPTKGDDKQLAQLIEKNIWTRFRAIHETYLRKWQGPDVDIYIFPINQTDAYFSEKLKGRSGVAFEDSLFLFVSDHLTDKELEAIYVHEYHHVCRMNKLKKDWQTYTLLDSVMFEGLAELAVLHYCGRAHTAYWTKLYPPATIDQYIDRYFSHNFMVKRTHPSHDDFLFGKNGLPQQIGYAVGYHLAKKYVGENKTTIQNTFSLDSSAFYPAP